jgi:hypothetical protein
MERLIIAEYQLKKLKLISRDIRRALLGEYPEHLPGHSRFLDLFSKALGYRSFSHLSVAAKKQIDSNTETHHAVQIRRIAIADAVMELLGTQAASERDKILAAIDVVLGKYDLREHDSSTPLCSSKNTKFSPASVTSCVRIRHRRRAIREKVNANDFGTREIDVGLKAALHVCSKWGLSEQETSELLSHGPLAANTAESQTRLLEMFSYVLRIYRLLNDVQQGRLDRTRNWIRRPMSVFNGATPFETMKEGPVGCSEVMEYLQHVLAGGS